MKRVTKCMGCGIDTIYTCTLGNYEVCAACEADFASNMCGAV